MNKDSLIQALEAVARKRHDAALKLRADYPDINMFIASNVSTDMAALLREIIDALDAQDKEPQG